jgi:hypothetical protein
MEPQEDGLETLERFYQMLRRHAVKNSFNAGKIHCARHEGNWSGVEIQAILLGGTYLNKHHVALCWTNASTLKNEVIFSGWLY